MKRFFCAAAVIFIAFTTSSAVFAEEITVDEQVIYEADGRKVTVTGYEDGWLGAELNVLVENDTESAFTLQIRDSSVNGIMTDFQASIDVEPGKKANDSITIMTSDLEDNGIEQIADIEMSLHIFDSETWDTIADTDAILIETSLSGEYEQEYDDSGEVVYDENSIRIVYQGLEEDDLWGWQPMFYIENNAETNITVQLNDTSVNGIMIDPSFSAEVVSGKKYYGGAVLFSSTLEENGISEILEIETTFHIYDSDTYSTFADSAPVTLSSGSSGEYVQEIDDSGEVLYEEGGIKIVSRGLVEDSIWGIQPAFYIENNSEQPITVQLRDTSINGYMADVSFSAEVMPGKICNDEALLLDDVEGDITEMETSFHIFNTETWDTIVDTEPIVISY
ncbi:MAG: hypothetical protein LUI39_14745 [Lachnospiraceae bacterium]|nr:hypothetical protein [Lachnospiraceae bacterium]